MKIEIDKLVPNKYNPRELFRGAFMDELGKSIKENGLIEPLVVRQLKNGKYEVVCGMRRYYALKELKVNEVECYVRTLNDEQAKLISLVENIQRQNLTPMEESRAYAINLGINFGTFVNLQTFSNRKTQDGKIKKLAEKIGKSPSTVYKRLHLLFLPEDIQNAIEAEEQSFPLMFANEIAKLRKIGKQDLAHRFMMNIYDEYKAKPDVMNLDQINKRVTKLLDKYTEQKDEEKENIGIRIKELKRNIIETDEARTKVIKKYNEDINEFYTTFNNPDIDNNEKDILIEGKNIIVFLDEIAKEYTDNREYESIVDRINIIGNNITDSYLLIERVKKDNIRICPFCHGLISTKIIKRDIENFQSELEILKEKRKNMAGIENDIIRSRKNIEKDILAIESKNEFMAEFKHEIEVLEGGN